MFHPLVNARVRFATAAELRQKKGLGFLRSFVLAGTIDDETIREGLIAVASDMGVALPTELTDPAPGVVGAIGDGSILQVIKDFFNSPLGQQILQALVALLLGLLVI